MSFHVDSTDISSSSSREFMNRREGSASTVMSDVPLKPANIVNRLESLKLSDNNKACKSTPSIFVGSDNVAVEDMDDDVSAKISNLKSAKEIIRRLSSNERPKLKGLKASKSHFEFANTAYGVRMLSKDISNIKVNLDVENLIIITKTSDVSLLYLTRELVEWLLVEYPNMTIYVEDFFNTDQFAANELCYDSKCCDTRIKYWNKKFIDEHDAFFDLCITMGGDGTVLFASWLFQQHVPPMVSFALGSLGFLTNFNFENFKEELPVILKSKIKTNLRMRLECKIYRRKCIEKDITTGNKVCLMECVEEYQVLNELVIDRGPCPFITMLELYGDDSLMTVAQADGLIISTPTGSTAYSLSAGGSLVYPSVNAISVTPICPHTLSFRPIVLPESMNLKVKVPMKSRNTAWLAFDGKGRTELQKGDYITISASPYAFPTVESSPNEFFESISRTLNWNIREQQKSFTHMLSRKNREKFATELINYEESDEDIEEKKIGGIKTTEIGGSESDDSSEDLSHSRGTQGNKISINYHEMRV